MIRGIFHQGSGLGNQLFRYVATRCLALDKGYDFSMIGKEYFKGKSFMNIDKGIDDYIAHHIEDRTGRVVPHTSIPLWEEKTNYYNPEFNFIEDETIIDGEFQDERYFGHRLKEIDQWLKVETMKVPNDTCVIGFRGGEFALFPELFLTDEYWKEAINIMINKGIKNFEVHTDDPKTAATILARCFPEGTLFVTIHDVGINWRSMRYAKYAIIANSSFYILPRLLNGGLTIAPRYWARRNTKEWSMPQNYYKNFTYL